MDQFKITQTQKTQYQRNGKISSDKVVGGQHQPKIYLTNKNITISPMMINGKLKSSRKVIEKEDQETLVMQQEIWGKQQKLEKMSEIRRSKEDIDLDKLTAIAILFLLFLLAFHLAPNQHYQPK